jgi:hypothetical protein
VRRIVVIAALLTCTTLAASGAVPAGAAPDSGVSGQVRLDGICGVRGGRCGSHRVAAKVTIRERDTHRRVRTLHPRDGRFRARLRPGTYTLRATSEQSPAPRREPWWSGRIGSVWSSSACTLRCARHARHQRELRRDRPATSRTSSLRPPESWRTLDAQRPLDHCCFARDLRKRGRRHAGRLLVVQGGRTGLDRRRARSHLNAGAAGVCLTPPDRAFHRAGLAGHPPITQARRRSCEPGCVSVGVPLSDAHRSCCCAGLVRLDRTSRSPCVGEHVRLVARREDVRLVARRRRRSFTGNGT